MTHHFLLFFCYFYTIVTAQDKPTPFSPPALPVAIRSPYQNAWFFLGDNPPAAGAAYPQMWQTASLAWYVAVRVDSVTYQVFGNAVYGNAPVQHSVQFTATRTSFLETAGPMDVSITFLSPIEPMDLLRQSLPFSYMCMNLTSNDGQPHDVQVHSDIDAEWASGDNNIIVNWTASVDSTAVILKTQVATPVPFTEILDHAQDTKVYYSMAAKPNQTWQIDGVDAVRGLFSTSGILANTSNNTFRAVNDNWPVFGISVDLGSIVATSEPLVWGLSCIRDPAIQYIGSKGETELRRSYYWSQYSSELGPVESALADFSRAYSAAVDFDSQLAQNASSISGNYANLVTLAAGQVFGSMDITLGVDGSGIWNMSDVKVFMKNFDPVGLSGSVNSVDTIFSAIPLFLTLNPDFIQYLLNPLFETQENPQNTLGTAFGSLGSNYPNATGPAESPTALGIEENANMLIMTLAYSQVTGDKSLINAHYPLLKRWTDYLVNTTLIPGNQISVDNYLYTNQTNVAIKGILGIKAMSILSQFAGQSEDESLYQNISSSYFSQWENMAMSSDSSHVNAEYGDDASSALMYNFFSDTLLKLNLIPPSLYQIQNTYYERQQTGQQYGVPADWSSAATRVDYQMLTAATTTNAETRDTFVTLIHNYAGSQQNSSPFTLEYSTVSGNSVELSNSAGVNNPAIGAIFSLLALQVSMKLLPSEPSKGDDPSTNGSMSSTGSASALNLGAIVGDILGGLIIISIVVSLIWMFRRRIQRRHRAAKNHSNYQRTLLQANGDPQNPDFSSPNIPSELPSSPQTVSADSQLVSHGSISEGVILYRSVQPDYALESPGNHIAHLGRSFTNAATIGSSHRNPYAVTDYRNTQLLACLEESTLSLTSASSNLAPNIPASRHSILQRGTPNDQPLLIAQNLTHNGDEMVRSQAMAAKQALLNEQMRAEMETLRREVERMREERGVVIEAPPSYS